MSDAQVIALFLEELKNQIQQLTFYDGFPVRGAVTVGPLMFSDKFLFGPALVEAVQLEKEALFPRILLSQSVLRYITPDSMYSSLVMQDADGHAFLDYLGQKIFLNSKLEWHRKFVEKGLASNLGRVRERQKYEWLARYHNFHAINNDMRHHMIDLNLVGEFSQYQDTTKTISLFKQL